MPKTRPIHLGVNIDHVATLRQARGTAYPRPADAVVIAERAGADSITVHLREDRRHIQDADLAAIAAVMQTHMNLEVAGQVERVTDACARLADAGIRVSLFIDPEERQLEAAVACGAPVVELHTGAYAEAAGAQRGGELRRIVHAAEYGARLGLVINAGHGLNYDNVGVVAAVPQIVELNIGHAIVSRAVFDGLAVAVSEMKRLMTEARGE